MDKEVQKLIKQFKKEVKKLHGRTKFFMEVKIISSECQVHDKPDCTVLEFKKQHGVKRIHKK